MLGECFPDVRRNEARVYWNVKECQISASKFREPLTKGHGVTSQKTRIHSLRRGAPVVGMGERWSVSIILVRNPKGRHSYENLNLNGRIVGPLNTLRTGDADLRL